MRDCCTERAKTNKVDIARRKASRPEPRNFAGEGGSPAVKGTNVVTTCKAFVGLPESACGGSYQGGYDAAYKMHYDFGSYHGGYKGGYKSG